MDGGQKKTFDGNYQISSTNDRSRFKYVYQLNSPKFNPSISLAKLTENVFHILSAKHQLMNGNGGWSYSLNRTNPVPSDKLYISSPTLKDNQTQ